MMVAKSNRLMKTISDYGSVIEEASELLIAIFAVRSTRLSIYSIAVCHRFSETGI